MLDYIDLKYEPTPNDLIVQYYMEPGRGLSYEKAASNVALESSIGTWTTISTMNPRIARTLKPTIFSIDRKNKIIKIAYPQELFELGNIPQIYSAIAGNIFGMKAVKNLRLMDIDFPEKIIKSFEGPLFGIHGIRKILRVKDRPLIGTIVKPKVGLTEKQHAKVAYEAWIGGLDIVKDDENLSSMAFNKFKKRVYETLKLRDRAEKETGEKKIYMPNITAETDEMLRRAEIVDSFGGEYIMVDILTVGWAALQTVRNYNKNLKKVIHAHRAMHAALTRNPKHGISMLALAKTARLIGVDQLHIGTVAIGKMSGSKVEELIIEEEIEYQDIYPEKGKHILEEHWYDIKPVLAVASGGLSPLSTADVIKVMGKNIVLQYGGGCHGHPDGTYAGAKAIRQSLDAALMNIPIKKYAKEHKELAKAIKKWGK